MNNVETIKSGMKWIAFALAFHFFFAIFSSSVPILSVMIGLVGVTKLIKASPKSMMLLCATLLLFVYYIFLYGREIHLWFIEKPGFIELIVGTGLKLFFLYALFLVLKDITSTETDRLLLEERQGTIFALLLTYCAVQPFVLNVKFHTAVYIFIGCVLISAIILSLLIHLIVRITSNLDNKSLGH